MVKTAAWCRVGWPAGGSCILPGQMATEFSSAPTSRAETGVRVLRSRTAFALYWFWIFLGAVLLTPLRDRLLHGESNAAPTGSNAVPGMPTERVEVGKRGIEESVGGGAGSSTRGPEPIQDPHQAMAPFYRALARTAARERGALTRVLHYGDSLIDQDLITGALRARLQRRYGEGGRGFVLLGRPWRWYNQEGITLFDDDGWDRFRLVGGRVRDGRLGLGCAAIEPRRGGRAWAQLQLSGVAAASLELSYLRLAAGGAIEIAVDGAVLQRIEVAASPGVPVSEFARVALPRTVSRIRVYASGRVRLFGIALDNDGPGVTWENLPLISARFHQLATLDPPHWGEQLRRRRPSLVVLQFGANDSISFGGDLERYGQKVELALARIRVALPAATAGCLVIGPLDRLERDATSGALRSPPVVRRVAERQRAAAFASRCAFFDGQRAMGGAGTMIGWLKQGLATKDMVHLSAKGSTVFAERLAQALEAGVQAHTSRVGGAKQAPEPARRPANAVQ